jgi:hypothetical protein
MNIWSRKWTSTRAYISGQTTAEMGVLISIKRKPQEREQQTKKLGRI